MKTLVLRVQTFSNESGAHTALEVAEQLEAVAKRLREVPEGWHVDPRPGRGGWASEPIRNEAGAAVGSWIVEVGP